MIRLHLLALLVGFLLDCVVGDPHWMPHPVRWIGRLIAWLEQSLRPHFPATAAGERLAGGVLVVLVLLVSGGLTALVLWLCMAVSKMLYLAVASVLCGYLLAARSLREESMLVAQALEKDGLEAGRKAVSMIVGRDTASLDELGVTKAAVETVAENTSDGVVAPLLYLALGGPVLGMLYKAINTMDSMVGYQNERYGHFGTAAAKLDDVVNFLPARLSGLLMCVGAFLCRLDGPNAWRIFCRDRLAHKSPNSAHTEAACAGALRVQLAGNSSYFGKMVEKPTIGDALRPVERRDIARANGLMYATALLALLLADILPLLGMML